MTESNIEILDFEKKELTKEEAIQNIEKLPDEIHAKITGRILSTIESIIPDTDSRLDHLKKTISRHISSTVIYAHKQVIKSLNVIDGGNRDFYKKISNKIGE